MSPALQSPTAAGSTPGAILAQPASPLSEAHFLLLRQVAAARRPVGRAARTARASAISILLIGLLGVPLAVLYPSWLAVVMVVGICAIGTVEYAGAQRMRRGQRSAAVMLGANQLGFMTLIVLYCAIQMATFSGAQVRSALVSAELQSQLSQLPEVERDLDQQLRSWAPVVTYGFYGVVIVLSVALQGGLAVYYFTRRRHLEALRATPAWVCRLLDELGT